MSLIDAASKIREGEELDVAAVDQYLKQHIAGLNGSPEITQFPGGASNLTYQVSYPGRDLILRRPPFGNIPKSAHDMLREAGIMAALKPVFPYVPDILVQCSDHSVMGCDFYVMQRLIGIIPRQNMPAEVKLDAAQTRQLCLNVIDRLIELHQVDIERAGLTGLGKGEGYVV